LNITSILTMVIILGIVWGGFIFFVYKATRFEKLKKDRDN